MRRHGPSIQQALWHQAAAWGVEYWAVVGRSPRLEIVVHFSATKAHLRPRTPRLWIPELGGHLELGHEWAEIEARTREVGPRFFAPDTAVDEPFAPGAQIIVGRGSSAEQCGIGAVVKSGGAPLLLTCGHAFSPGETEVRVRQGGSVVATLNKSYLDDQDPLDAALCDVTDAGRDLLDQSGTAATWFQSFHTPVADDNEQPVTFWPAHSAPAMGEPFRVTSFSACNPVPGIGGARCGYVLLPFGADNGDSGSILAFGDAHYGICSFRAPGDQTFFTPTATILARVVADFGDAALWNPNSDS